MEKILRAITAFSICIFFASQTLSAQDTIYKNNIYRVRILRNAPEVVANAHLSLLPVYFDANNLNISAGAGAEATYLFKNRISLSASYQYAYIDRTAEYAAADAPGLAATGSSPRRKLELGAAIYFHKDTTTKKEDIFLSKDKLGEGYMNFSVEVAARRLRLIGLRGGFIAYKSYIKDIESTIDFRGFLVEDPSRNVVELSGAYSTMMETNTIYMGISRLVISDLFVEIADNGKRTLQRRTELYGDIMYAPSILFYNMNAHGTANSIGFREYNVNENTNRSRIGARIGFTRWSLKPIGISYGLEAGLRPGPAAGAVYNTYIILRAAINLSAHI